MDGMDDDANEGEKPVERPKLGAAAEAARAAREARRAAAMRRNLGKRKQQQAAMTRSRPAADDAGKP